ncbi:unnamed protein product, partial [Mesorhabditis belari]|uniref:Peroxisomal membrane protein 4 n=1 Tax=Mesorhabditis belari TaxID=2138241 RepID=A0AAF3EZ94_9BILA
MIDKALFIMQNWELIGNYLLSKYRHHHWLLAALKGLRNGIVYGCKVRFPHALVMVFLFQEGTILQKFQTILRLTKTHATNLAKFVFSYKLIKGGLEKFTGKVEEWHSFVAAFLMGYYVFGENNAVNMQINLYLLSRIAIGLAKLAAQKEVITQPERPIFPWFAALVWGIVLWLFEHHKDVLQLSLQKSMTYLYHESEIWTGIRNFLLRNSDKNI